MPRLYQEYLLMKSIAFTPALLLFASIFFSQSAYSNCSTQSDQGKKTEQALQAFYAGDDETMSSLLADVYVQHSNAMDGKDALLNVLRKGKEQGWLSRQVADQFTPLRTVSENDLAATHYLDTGEDKVYVDIFRFDADGRISEHWDISQKNHQPNKSGRTMVDGNTTVDCSIDKAQQTQNKQTVMLLHDEFFAKGNKEILPGIMHEGYLQHNPHGKDGREFFSGLVDRMGLLDNVVHRLIADGDLVYAHVEWPTHKLASIDIYRFKEGKIAEHWDVVQEIPAKLPHDNGFF